MLSLKCVFLIRLNVRESTTSMRMNLHLKYYLFNVILVKYRYLLTERLNVGQFFDLKNVISSSKLWLLQIMFTYFTYTCCDLSPCSNSFDNVRIKR